MTLSTHVLDLSQGRPAVGVALRLLQGGSCLFSGRTDADGRCPDLRTLVLSSGRYCLEFTVADYFRAADQPSPDPPFLDVIRIDFGLSGEGGHYHVPLLLSPFGYSTYRGS